MLKNNQDTCNSFFQFLSSTILFLFSIQVLTLGISLLQIRISAWMARGILGIALVAALVPIFLDNGLPNFLTLVKWFRLRQIPFLAFLGLAALMYLILWAAAYVMPDLSWDGNAYHIPTLAMWDIRGYIHWVNTIYLEPLINGYPKGAELISYILVKAFGNSMINAVNLVFLPVGVFGIAYLARSLGAKRLVSVCAGAAFLMIPVNINQSVTTYVDTAYAACAVGLIAALVSLVNTRASLIRKSFFFGAALGLALSVKSTGFALSGLAILFLVIIWIQEIFTPMPSPTQYSRSHQRAKMALQRLALLIGIALIALISGGYWYIRNFFMTGSPLYPVGLSFLGHTVFPGVSISAAIAADSNTSTQLKNLSPLTRIFFTWAQGIKAWPVSIRGYDNRDAGLGFLWLFAGIPSITMAAFFLPKQMPSQKRSLLILAGLTSLAFLTTPLNWWARYTVWIYALGLPCFALVLTRWIFTWKSCPYIRYLASAWVTVCVGLLLFEAAYCTVDNIALASPGPLRSNLTKAFIPSTWAWPACYLFPDMQGTALEIVLTHEGNVGIGPHGNMEFWRYAGLVGQLSQPIGFRRLVFLPESQDLSQRTTIAGLKYIIWDRSVPLPLELTSQAKSVTPVTGFLVLSLP